ncbi:RDD family protein [Streptomyces sp. CA-111067]|uniref:RDD family protein n=1 Tax=Streptomyces sp. CA-111067 TaxID=3240046 RepID=UPI003D97AD6B
MDNRDAIGSWLSGPRAAVEQMGGELGYRGERLGLPEEGPGSVAPVGRRVIAIFIDWILCVLIAYGLIAHRDYNSSNTWALAVFGVVSLLTISLVGSTPGKRLMRLRVVRLDGGRLSPLAVLIRTVLLLIVIPAVVWDRDTRGLHDKAANAVQVRI